MFTICISGSSCSGKSTLATLICTLLREQRCRPLQCTVLHQDTFYWPLNSPNLRHIDAVPSKLEACIDWESVSSFDMRSLITRVSDLRDKCDVAIIEGLSVMESKELTDEADIRLHLHINDMAEFFRRRSDRHYDPPDVLGYAKHVAWPAYLARFSAVVRCKEAVNVDDISQLKADASKVQIVDVTCDGVSEEWHTLIDKLARQIADLTTEKAVRSCV